MSKHLTSQRYVFKISTSRLKRAGWNLSLTVDQARESKELIALSESQLLRFIDELNGVENSEEYIADIKQQIKKLRHEKDILVSRPKIKKLYKILDKYLFKQDYVCVVIDSKKDYYKIFKDGFKINGITFRRLLGTSGGIKNNTIVFVNEKLLPELKRRIDNGRNLSKEFIPAKLEAYMSLVCSSSTPVSYPNGVVVVHDCITHFKADVIELDYGNRKQPSMKYIHDKEIELDNSDGYGMGMPELMKRWGDEIGAGYLLPACVIRNSFCKGAVFPVDFQKFAHDHGFTTITDVWGNVHDIDKVELILTESMLKLWDSYSSIDDYINNCKENHYSFAITKTSEEHLEDVRTMNYQFLQSYEFTDEQIDELIAPTVKNIKDIMSDDYRKTILYLKGIGLNDENINYLDNSIGTALMIEPELIHDPYIKHQINSMIQKRINDAKIGVLDVPGNYSFVSGDPYSLCQSMFGMEVTGLLKSGQVYSKYWIDHGVNKITSFRAPMTAHNNIRLLDVVHNDEMDEFYKYMTTPTIFNSWDTCTMAMNGMDMDGDCVINTSMPVIVNNTKPLPAISCVQRKGVKCVPTEEDFVKSNIASFGNAIGAITNKVTSMYEIQSRYGKDSREYRVLDYRIKCGQLLQQDEIDKVKGIEAKGMPEKWFSWISNKIDNGNNNKEKKENWFNRKIVVDKKPYFMQYVYPAEHTKLKKYKKTVEQKCLINFNMSLDELLNQEILTDDQKVFVEYYYKKMPLGISDCTMNRICKKIEDIFDDIKLDNKDSKYDYSILRCEDAEYSYRLYSKIESIYEQYKYELVKYMADLNTYKLDSFEKMLEKIMLNNDFRKRCIQQCPNEEYLCNMLIDMCYGKSQSGRHFVWDMCGDVIIQNLLKRHNYQFSYPTLDENGDIEFNGKRFSMKTIDIKNLDQFKEEFISQ